MIKPLISVIMSVYNGAKDAPAGIDCILKQTFKDLELIVIDNGSTRDNTAAVLKDVAKRANDPRLRIEHLHENIGLAGALNYGIALAQGRYIARQDHDDISRPDRFKQQFEFMEENPECGLLGTRAEIWVVDEPAGRAHDHPLDNATLQFDLLFNNPFVHSSVLIRRSALDAVGLYCTDPSRQPPEDYELWSRVARQFEVRNIEDRLLVYRELPQSLSREGANSIIEKVLRISAENLAHKNGLAGASRTCQDVAALTHAIYAKISPNVDIELVCTLIERAARLIEQANPGADLSDRVVAAVYGVRHQHGVWLERHEPPQAAHVRQRAQSSRSFPSRLTPASVTDILKKRMKRLMGF